MEDWMRSSSCRGTLLAFLAILLAGFAAPILRGQSAGPNVNMVSGTGWTNGDPFLQRQNEPSIAVSTRNTLHLLAGANDYRGVDLPGLLGSTERGDAWLGLFKSFDGGQTWQSTLLPGYPLDQTKELNGLPSPIHGFQAAADPTVRPGTSGLFYYSGIAFNRGTGGAGVVFLSRFIDNNNKENGDPTHTNGSLTTLAPTDPIQYLGTVVVDSGTSGQFLDKPWIATDIPRGSLSAATSVRSRSCIALSRGNRICLSTSRNPLARAGPDPDALRIRTISSRLRIAATLICSRTAISSSISSALTSCPVLSLRICASANNSPLDSSSIASHRSRCAGGSRRRSANIRMSAWSTSRISASISLSFM